MRYIIGKGLTTFNFPEVISFTTDYSYLKPKGSTCTIITQFYPVLLLNTAKNTREQGTTRDPFTIRVRVRAAYLSSVIVLMSLEAK